MDSKLKHDFTNNCLRIEILQKMILDELEKGKLPSKESLEDYLRFIQEQTENLERLKMVKATANSDNPF